MAIHSNCLIVLNYPFGWIFFAPTKKNLNERKMKIDIIWETMDYDFLSNKKIKIDPPWQLLKHRPTLTVMQRGIHNI